MVTREDNTAAVPASSKHELEEYEVSSHLNRVRFDPSLKTKRGWVLIIKNTAFEDELPSKDEVENLISIFQRYYYNVRYCSNISAETVLKCVKYYASKVDSKCFVVFISSHGNYSKLKCMGNNDVETKDILTTANTAELHGKPKCIFIDACRIEDPEDVGNRPEIPDDNFFVGMSSLAFNPSYADEYVGDFYLHRIATIFEESFALPAYAEGKVRDIDYLMKKVHRDVQEYAEELGETQIPIYESSLKRILFLQGTEQSRPFQ